MAGPLAVASVAVRYSTSGLKASFAAVARVVRKGATRLARIIASPFRSMGSVIKRVVKSALSPLGAAAGILIGALTGGLALRKAITTFGDFEQAMARVKGVSGATAAEFKKLSDRAKELGKTTEFTSTQAAKA